MYSHSVQPQDLLWILFIEHSKVNCWQNLALLGSIFAELELSTITKCREKSWKKEWEEVK